VISRFVLLVLAVSSLASHAGTYAQFRTAWGDIDVELYDDDKPVTVGNFLRYVQSGRYSNMFFHRCPTNQLTGITDFVVQGGGFFVTTNGMVDRVPNFGNIPNEFGVGRRFSNTYGTIAMAKVAGDTNSANSQFFFNLNNNSFLDATNDNGYFTVFGRIVGTNSIALNSYRGLSINRGIKNLSSVNPEWSTLPVTYFGSRDPTLNDLEYANISVLHLSVTATNGVPELSWNSLGGTNHVYHVEFSTNLPPVWQTLVSTNGIGRNQTMRIRDSSAFGTPRFYRVRIGL
jgi:cyclophilin family peptidyl-prolyl cis-trans isomerase